MKKYSKLLVLFFTLVSFNGFAQCIASFNSTQPNCPDVQFLDASFADFPASITSRAWDFGDGSPVDSTTNPTHTYAANGAYDVMLIIETSSGCRDTVIENENGLLVPKKSAQKLSVAILSLINNSYKINQMGLKSREIAEEKFDVVKVNNSILKEMGI